MHMRGVAALLLLAGCASAGDGYSIIQQRASIPYGATTVTGYVVDAEKALIMDVRKERFYRLQLEPRCRDRLLDTPAVGFLPESGTDVKAGVRLDIDGEKCRILRLDEIQRPAKTP